MSEFVQVGFENFVQINRVIAVMPYMYNNKKGGISRSAPSYKFIANARVNKIPILDATMGRKSKTMIVMDNGFIIFSALAPETVIIRHEIKQNEEKTPKQIDNL